MTSIKGATSDGCLHYFNSDWDEIVIFFEIILKSVLNCLLLHFSCDLNIQLVEEKSKVPVKELHISISVNTLILIINFYLLLSALTAYER